MSDPVAPVATTPNIVNDIALPPVGKEKGPGKYRVKILRTKCIGAASCVAIAPKVFALDEKNLAYIISEDELDETKMLAAQSCPTMAIIVEDIETNQQVWPK